MLYHRVVYRLLHLCIEFYVLLSKIWRYTSIVAKCTVAYLFGRTSRLNAPENEKLPSHIGVLLNEENISFYDLSNLIIWCLCLGVRHMTVYDVKGYVKENDEVFIHQAILRKHEILGKEAKKYNIVFKNSKHSSLTSESTSNGHKIENFYINLLSKQDGKQRIIEAAQKFCSDAIQMPSLLFHFHSIEFDKYIKSALNVPDPELIIVFGPNFILQGYLPWHIRLSEILWLPTHHNLQLQEFLNVLSKYDKCEQRFGK